MLKQLNFLASLYQTGTSELEVQSGKQESTKSMGKSKKVRTGPNTSICCSKLKKIWTTAKENISVPFHITAGPQEIKT